MKPDPARIPDFLLHILDAADRIQRYTRGMGKLDFRENQMVQDAVVRNIEIIGEATRNIEHHDRDFGAKHPEMPLRDIVSMRNQLIHGYSNVSLGLVWKTVSEDIPTLRTIVQQVYDSLPK
jgi:uncharacterized protein with HEPN domain